MSDSARFTTNPVGSNANTIRQRRQIRIWRVTGKFLRYHAVAHNISPIPGYGSTPFLDRNYDLRVHPSPSTSSVVLEYSSAGRVVATGQPYSNRYISVVVIKDRKVTEWRDYLDPLRVFAALEGRPSNRTPEKGRDDQQATLMIESLLAWP